MLALLPLSPERPCTSAMCERYQGNASRGLVGRRACVSQRRPESVRIETALVPVIWHRYRPALAVHVNADRKRRFRQQEREQTHHRRRARPAANEAEGAGCHRGRGWRELAREQLEAVFRHRLHAHLQHHLARSAAPVRCAFCTACSPTMVKKPVLR